MQMLELYLHPMDQEGTGHDIYLGLLDLFPPNSSTSLLLAMIADNSSNLFIGLSEYCADAVVTANLFNIALDGLKQPRSLFASCCIGFPLCDIIILPKYTLYNIVGLYVD